MPASTSSSRPPPFTYSPTPHEVVQLLDAFNIDPETESGSNASDPAAAMPNSNAAAPAAAVAATAAPSTKPATEAPKAKEQQQWLMLGMALNKVQSLSSSASQAGSLDPSSLRPLRDLSAAKDHFSVQRMFSITENVMGNVDTSSRNGDAWVQLRRTMVSLVGLKLLQSSKLLCFQHQDTRTTQAPHSTIHLHDGISS
jgi:hypothetical protein